MPEPKCFFCGSPAAPGRWWCSPLCRWEYRQEDATIACRKSIEDTKRQEAKGPPRWMTDVPYLH